MRVLQINDNDANGGAAAIAYNLHRTYRDLGVDTWLSVGRRFRNDPAILEFCSSSGVPFWRRAVQPRGNHLIERTGEIRRNSLSLALRASVSRVARGLAEPRRAAYVLMGWDDFRFPATKTLLKSINPPPDIIHAHNLHGKYFDLRVLPAISKTTPFFLTLHDAWTFSGHCAHSLDCERWKSGCGRCPDLSLHPRVYRDATWANWNRKKKIFADCRIHIISPCRWLADRAQESILRGAMLTSRVIPNGIDLSVFRPARKEDVKRKLGIYTQSLPVILFAADCLCDAGWKDARLFRRVLARLTDERTARRSVLVGIGTPPRDAPALGRVRFVPRQLSPQSMAEFFQAADIYLHPARADTFPTMILESLACETTVIATAVGGIPEQIATHSTSTGILVPSEDAEAMTSAIELLITHPELRDRMGRAAATVARERFDLRQQAKVQLEWYREIVTRTTGTSPQRLT